MGWWEGELKGKLILKLQLRDIATGAVPWRDTIVGASAVKGSEGPEAIFSATLSDALHDLLSDTTFIQNLSPVAGQGATRETNDGLSPGNGFVTGALASVKRRATLHERAGRQTILEPGNEVQLLSHRVDGAITWWWVKSDGKQGWIRESDLEGASP